MNNWLYRKSPLMKKGRKMRVTKHGGQRYLVRNLAYCLVLPIALLISGCSSSPLPPVERVVTKIEVKTRAVKPPQKPAQIAIIDFNSFELITQTNIETILLAVRDGKREPLNHMSLPYTDYLNMATWMKAVENYIISAEQYFKEVEERYKDLQSRNK